MATLKIKLRLSANSSKEGVLFYQVIHHRIVKQITTRHKIFPSEWDKLTSRIIIPPNTEPCRRNYLTALEKQVQEESAHLREIIDRLQRSGTNYTTAKIVQLYNLPSRHDSFLAFIQDLINQLTQIGKLRTAETYATTLNSFTRFRQEKDIPLEAVDSNLMVKYEIYLKETGVCPNTSSYYMRSLRAMYNRAVEKELTPQRNPFKHVYTGIDKTVKRAVPLKVIRQIRNLDLTLTPMLDYARDIFMFSFYTRGMSFVDMAYLKKKDLQNGILSYRRQKTNQQLLIKWEKPMQDIVDKYDTTGTPYLLPIIKNNGKDERLQYKNAAHLVNNKLKIIGAQLELAIPLTTYVARHGWASIARSKNIPIATISEAMGHDSESTTRIYLASLDTSAVDKANSMILKSI